MTLSIDISDIQVVKLELESFGKLSQHQFVSDRDLSERLVPEIQKFLKKSKVKLSQLSKINTSLDSGHFSRARTGAAVASALSYAIGLKQGGEGLKYDKAPNISKPKTHSLTSFQKRLS